MTKSQAKQNRQANRDVFGLISGKSPKRPPGDGVAIGTVVALDRAEAPLVDFPQNPIGASRAARTTITLTRGDVGREVVLLFESGDPSRPIVIGLIERSSHQQLSIAGTPQDAVLDGERVVLTAEREIVLRCGEASITITRAGKILLHGTYVLSRSSGVNRIKGGSVQIN